MNVSDTLVVLVGGVPLVEGEPDLLRCQPLPERAHPDHDRARSQRRSSAKVPHGRHGERPIACLCRLYFRGGGEEMPTSCTQPALRWSAYPRVEATWTSKSI
jgi:hypothetical protein